MFFLKKKLFSLNLNLKKNTLTEKSSFYSDELVDGDKDLQWVKTWGKFMNILLSFVSWLFNAFFFTRSKLIDKIKMYKILSRLAFVKAGIRTN